MKPEKEKLLGEQCRYIEWLVGSAIGLDVEVWHDRWGHMFMRRRGRVPYIRVYMNESAAELLLRAWKLMEEEP